MDLRGRPQVVRAFGSGRFRNKLTVLGRQVTVALRNDLITGERAFPQRTAFGPSLRVGEYPFHEALGYPCVVAQKGKIDIDQRVRDSEPLPSEGRTPETINNPTIPGQQIGVRLQELMLGNFDASRRELHHIHDVERQARQLCQSPSNGGFPATGIAKYRYPHHAELSATRDIGFEPATVYRMNVGFQPELSRL